MQTTVPNHHPDVGPLHLTSMVRETGYEIHCYLGHGYLEKVYENALVNRLRKRGLQVDQQRPVTVRDEDGSTLGEYIADVIVENTLLVEIKVARGLADEHVAQLLGYLKATGLMHGLLINFGSYRFEIRKYILNSPSNPA